MPTFRVAANTYAVRQIHRGAAGSMQTGGIQNTAGFGFFLEGARFVEWSRDPNRWQLRQIVVGMTVEEEDTMPKVSLGSLTQP